MRRTQIQLEDELFDKLRQQAFQRRCSISSLVRECLAEKLTGPKEKPSYSGKKFGFVGAGRSRQGQSAPVSERHDDALSAIWDPRKKR